MFLDDFYEDPPQFSLVLYVIFFSCIIKLLSLVPSGRELAIAWFKGQHETLHYQIPFQKYCQIIRIHFVGINVCFHSGHWEGHSIS